MKNAFSSPRLVAKSLESLHDVLHLGINIDMNKKINIEQRKVARSPTSSENIL